MLRLIPFILLVGLIVFLMILLYQGYFLPKRELRDKKLRKEIERKWKAIQLVNDTKRRWLDYELSETVLLELPSILNVAVPEVGAFHREMNNFNKKYPDFNTPSFNANVDENFILAATRLAAAFNKAEKKAKEIDS